MSEWKKKRFWSEVTIQDSGAGWIVQLDGRMIRTPGKATLSLPTAGLAEAVADEWRAQEGEINPALMPYTRSTNSAIDTAMVHFADVADMLAAYGDADLLCYRAQTPSELVERQAQAWDPYLDWAAETLGARLHPRTGVIHESQDAQALKTLSERVYALSAFELTAFHDLVSLSGSLILGFAAAQDMHAAHRIWAVSRTDETWQEEQWGVDEEAQEIAEIKKSAFLHAKSFFDLSRTP